MICTSQLPCGCKRPSSGGSPKSSCLGSASLVTSCLYFARRRWINHDEHQIWLVVSTPPKNISQLRLLFPIYGKIKNVPNHHFLYLFTLHADLDVEVSALSGRDIPTLCQPSGWHRQVIELPRLAPERDSSEFRHPSICGTQPVLRHRDTRAAGMHADHM